MTSGVRRAWWLSLAWLCVAFSAAACAPVTPPLLPPISPTPFASGTSEVIGFHRMEPSGGEDAVLIVVTDSGARTVRGGAWTATTSTGTAGGKGAGGRYGHEHDWSTFGVSRLRTMGALTVNQGMIRRLSRAQLRYSEVDDATAARLLGRCDELRTATPTLERDVSDAPKSEAVHWLHSLPVPEGASCFVAWPHERVVVATAYSDFVAKHAGLWLPSADDVLVFGSDGGWAVMLDHEEVFRFYA